MTFKIITSGYIGGKNGILTTITHNDIPFGKELGITGYCAYIEIPIGTRPHIECHGGITYNEYFETMGYPFEDLIPKKGMTIVGWDYNHGYEKDYSEMDIISDVLETVKKLQRD